MPRLRRSDSSGPGIRRLKSGKGFRFVRADGSQPSEADLERIHALVIPPAWTDVWIAPYPNGHIQATGVDAAGRTQYMYHPVWREQKDRVKFDRAMSLAESLPAARRRVTTDLRADEPTKQRSLAAAFRMLDSGSLRVGSERYAEANGSHGLTTLLCSHATVRGDTIALEFPGKSGKDWSSEIRDAELAAIVRGLKRRGGAARLLAYKDGGAWHPLGAADVNAYVREQTGGEYTAKDFRTLRGTVAAAVALAKAGPATTPTARKKVVAQAVRDVSALLGNTPAVARASYIDPRVIDHYDHGRTIDAGRGSGESELRRLLVE